MRRNILTIMISLLFLSMMSEQAVAENKISYSEMSFPKESIDLTSIRLENCQSGIRIKDNFFLISCNNKKKDTSKNYGLRLFFIENKEKPVIRFESQGAGDSYYMKLSAFKKNNAESPLIILAESGAEISYGVSVYMLNDLQIKYIGDIDVTVDLENNPSSVVPFTLIEEDGKSLVVRFSRDVLKMKKDGNYKTISKDQIKYIYAGDKLKEITEQKNKNKKR